MKKAVHEGLLFCVVKRQHKNTDTYPCQSVLQASWNQAAALNRRKNLRQPCSCRPGMRAHAARDGIRAFAIGYHIFYESAESVFLSRCRESGRGKIRSLYTGIRDSFLSKLHSGRNYRDIHDRWEIEFFHGVSGFPSPYIYIA